MAGSSSSRSARSSGDVGLLLAALALSACGDGADGPEVDAARPPVGVADAATPGRDAGDPDRPSAADGGRPTTWTCASMQPELEKSRPGFGRVCVEAVLDRATWESISVPERPGSDLVRVTKFFLPATEAAGIPPSFFDANSFMRDSGENGPGGTLSRPWHLYFASHFLPLRSPPTSSYWGPTRVAYAGYLAEIEVTGVGRVFGYYVEADDYPCETHKRVHADMAEAFTLRPLYRAVFGPLPSPNKLPAGCDVPTLVLR